MKFGLTCHAADDWAVPDHETDYIYATQAEAEAAAERWMRDAIAAGTPAEYVGVYVMSDDRDVEAGGDPSVEDLFAIHNGQLLYTAAP